MSNMFYLKETLLSGGYLWFSSHICCSTRRLSSGSYCCALLTPGGGTGCGCPIRPNSWCTSLPPPPPRSCSGIGSPAALAILARLARLRLFTFLRTQHCTDNNRVHTIAIKHPIYTNTMRSPPRFWPRNTLPAIVREIPVRMPAMNRTCNTNNQVLLIVMYL